MLQHHPINVTGLAFVDRKSVCSFDVTSLPLLVNPGMCLAWYFIQKTFTFPDLEDPCWSAEMRTSQSRSLYRTIWSNFICKVQHWVLTWSLQKASLLQSKKPWQCQRIEVCYKIINNGAKFHLHAFYILFQCKSSDWSLLDWRSLLLHCSPTIPSIPGQSSSIMYHGCSKPLIFLTWKDNLQQ